MISAQTDEQYEEDIQLIVSEKNGCGAIYLSNLEAAQNINTLKKLNIKAVISIAKGAFLTHSQLDLPNYMYVPAFDHKSFDLSVHFDKTYDFIDRNRKKSNVLVHCLAGISRSATIVIAYLMRKFNWTLVQAYTSVRRMRPIVQPNEGFISQLNKFQDVLRSNPEMTKQNMIFEIRNRSSCEASFIEEHNSSRVEVKAVATAMNPKDKIKPINLQEKINALRQKFGKNKTRQFFQDETKPRHKTSFKDYILDGQPNCAPAEITKAKRRRELYKKINN